MPWFPAVGDGVGEQRRLRLHRSLGRIALNVGTSAALRIVTPTPGQRRVRGLWRYRVDRDVAIVGGATSEGGNVYAWCRDVLKLPDDDDRRARARGRATPTATG